MILSNQVRCLECRDEPYSAHRHDYKQCECGAIAVDGGMDYLRRVGDGAYKELSVQMDDNLAKHLMSEITESVESGRNGLGVLCKIARVLRDNSYEIRETKGHTKKMEMINELP